MPAYPSLTALFLSFLKLGATAFGGPAMVPFIGKMAVEQRNWLDGGTFRDGVALCQTIPGATAMQTAAYVGFRAQRVAAVAIEPLTDDEEWQPLPEAKVVAFLHGEKILLRRKILARSQYRFRINHHGTLGV